VAHLSLETKTAARLRRLRADNPGYSTAKNRKYQEQNPEKRQAHKAVEYALKVGSLTRSPCEVCGGERSEAHHDDYGKALEVRWLCRTHHIARHKALAIN